MRKRVVLIFSLAILLIFSAWLIHWILTSEERNIKKTIFSLRDAIENKDINACSFFISEIYSDAFGLDKHKLIELGKLFFEQASDIKINIHKLIISVHKENASVDCFGTVRYVYTGGFYKRLEFREEFSSDKKNRFLRLNLRKEKDNNWRLTHSILISKKE